MNPIAPDRRTRISAALLFASCSVPLVHAAPVTWTGSGASALWSEALNWSPQGAPANGDDLVFAGLPPRTISLFDLSRTLGSLSFDPDATLFATHVSGDGAELAFSGPGIRSLDSVGAPRGRQVFFADAGSSGGTILFKNSSGTNIGSYQFARPVDITAQGGSIPGAAGGRIVFQDKATTSDTTFDAFRAAGANVAGASGGEIIVRDDALLKRQSGVTAAGGAASGAPGGQARFLGKAQLAGGASVLAGQSGGLGGRLDFSGNAIALATASIYAEGGTSALAGSEARASFRGDARMIGSGYLGASGVAGAGGGRIDFYERSTHDTTAFDATLGSVGIYNVGAVASGAGGGALMFHDDSAVLGAHLAIFNQTAEYLAPGALAGSTSFLDRSGAGQVSIQNAGAVGAGAAGGTVYFRNQANAQNASITSLGGASNGAGGGRTQFSDTASAGAAILRNAGGSAAGASGATLDFLESSRAGSATIANAPGEMLGAEGGVTTFAGHAGAGSAFISNEMGLSASSGGAGRTYFKNTASAQQARIDNHGGLAFPVALTAFSDDASAGSARITNLGARSASVYGGFTQFFDRASAGTANIVTAGGGVDKSFGGVVQFFGDSTAGNATIDLRAATVAGAGGGTAFFRERAIAGNATFIVQGSQANNLRGPEAAGVTFEDASSASSASFAVGGNLFTGGAVGEVRFQGSSTAASATFSLIAGHDRGGALTFKGSDALHIASAGSASIVNRGAPAGAPAYSTGGITTFQADATAAAARITNESGVASGLTLFFGTSSAGAADIVNAGGQSGESGGRTLFSNDSTADRAVIVSRAGAIGASGFNASGNTDFVNHSSAGNARITAEGAGNVGDVGGQIHFSDTATAAHATLIADGGTGGGTGGSIRFAGAADGGNARIVLTSGTSGAAGGVLDISASTAVFLQAGSIEGGGSINLGGRSLVLVNSSATSTFSGVISGAPPPVFPSLSVLAGALTLSGANLYSGRTSIGDGLHANSGKLIAASTTGSATGSGAVSIQRGGTLAGSGFIAGPVTLLAGGTIAPGDPVTLTLGDTLTWDGGGAIRLVLGADDAGSDHLVVHRLVRGSAGSFAFQFVDMGINPATSYSLLQFDEIDGFSVADFSFVGVAGSFSLANGTLGFTAAPVPEPGLPILFAAGLLCIWRVRVATERRRGQNRSA